MSHRDAFRPRSVTKLHLPPCCSLCTPSIHSPCQYPLPVSSSPPISWPHHLSIILLLHVEVLLSPFSASYFPFIHPTNRLFLPLRQPLILPSLPPYSTIHSPTQPPCSLPVCSDRFCGSRAGCVNVKPFPAMIMFITRCASRCPWINTNWRSTLQR